MKPPDAETIACVKKLAASNRAAYNEVFLHTPRDSFKTMAEGRQAYRIRYKDRSGKAHEVFSAGAKPDLQPAYMSAAGVHNVPAAMGKLSASIIGFWVEMPLNWGTNTLASPTPPLRANQSIAKNGQLESGEAA